MPPPLLPLASFYDTSLTTPTLTEPSGTWPQVFDPTINNYQNQPLPQFQPLHQNNDPVLFDDSFFNDFLTSDFTSEPLTQQQPPLPSIDTLSSCSTTQMLNTIDSSFLYETPAPVQSANYDYSEMRPVDLNTSMDINEAFGMQQQHQPVQSSQSGATDSEFLFASSSQPSSNADMPSFYSAFTQSGTSGIVIEKNNQLKLPIEHQLKLLTTTRASVTTSTTTTSAQFKTDQQSFMASIIGNENTASQSSSSNKSSDKKVEKMDSSQRPLLAWEKSTKTSEMT
jgi:hypothetical protein